MDAYVSLAYEIVPVKEEVGRKAAELIQVWREATGKKLKLPDAMVAATAILHEAILVSNNDRDFLFLRNHGLVYENPIRSQEDLQEYRKNML